MRHIFLCNKEIKSCTQPSKKGIKLICLSFEKIQQCWRSLRERQPGQSMVQNKFSTFGLTRYSHAYGALVDFPPYKSFWHYKTGEILLWKETRVYLFFFFSPRKYEFTHCRLATCTELRKLRCDMKDSSSGLEECIGVLRVSMHNPAPSYYLIMESKAKKDHYGCVERSLCKSSQRNFLT